MSSSANSASTVSARFPFATLAFQRLCWKEYRQIAPLAIVLLVINLLMHLLPVTSDRSALQQIHLVFLMLVPCLFAIGAGSLLVSQEKDQRTIGWLSSLPIASRQILATKLLVSLLGLAMIWIACLLIAFVFDRASIFPQALGDIPFPLPIAVINSIFLLCLSIATAWRWQSPLVALVMVVPIAAVPTFATIAFQNISPEVRLPDLFVGGLYLLLSGAFLWYGWRSGLAFLSSKPQSAVWQNLSRVLERRGSRGNLLGARPQGLASTLLWQFSVQNRMVPIAGVAIFLLPTIAYAFQAALKDNAIIPIIAWLIISWLGASVFQSDSVQQRIKFLAERGVSPSTIWWTRQIIPFGLVLTATVIAILLSKNIMYTLYHPIASIPLMMLGIPFVLLAHAAAQWQGQLVRSPIVSLILAPATSLGAIGYLVFAIVGLGAPYWMTIVPIMIAFLATRVMTEPWMDGRTGLKYWLLHGTLLFAAMAIPAVPLFVTMASYPGMPRSVEQRFKDESKRNIVSGNPIELVLAKSFVEVERTTNEPGANAMESSAAGEQVGGTEMIVIEATMGFVEQLKRNVASIEEQLTERSGAVRWSQAVGILAAEAMLTRAQLDTDPTNEVSKERYRTAMRVLTEVVKRMRMSWRLIDQEYADRIEIWMYQQVQANDGREALGESNWSAITSILSDKTGRMSARRRAIVQSWNLSSLQARLNGRAELGGMMMKTASGLAGLRESIASHRCVSRASWLLLEYLESKDQSEAEKRFAEFASVWGVPASRNSQSGLSLESVLRIPGQNWFGDWENYPSQ